MKLNRTKEEVLKRTIQIIKDQSGWVTSHPRYWKSMMARCIILLLIAEGYIDE